MKFIIFTSVIFQDVALENIKSGNTDINISAICDVEKKVNTWLKKNPNIKIISMSHACSDKDNKASVALIYTTN
jgi:hypothetical protein